MSLEELILATAGDGRGIPGLTTASPKLSLSNHREVLSQQPF
jgi:hypothetical protein